MCGCGRDIDVVDRETCEREPRCNRCLGTVCLSRGYFASLVKWPTRVIVPRERRSRFSVVCSSTSTVAHHGHRRNLAYNTISFMPLRKSYRRRHRRHVPNSPRVSSSCLFFVSSTVRQRRTTDGTGTPAGTFDRILYYPS